MRLACPLVVVLLAGFGCAKQPTITSANSADATMTEIQTRIVQQQRLQSLTLRDDGQGGFAGDGTDSQGQPITVTVTRDGPVVKFEGKTHNGQFNGSFQWTGGPPPPMGQPPVHFQKP